jgi:hypothetical protein
MQILFNQNSLQYQGLRHGHINRDLKFCSTPTHEVLTRTRTPNIQRQTTKYQTQHKHKQRNVQGNIHVFHLKMPLLH